MNLSSFVSKQRYVLLVGLLGAIAGFVYWKYVGCLTGTCPIKSVWYNMTGYGALMGGLIGGMFNSKRADKAPANDNK